MTRLNLVVLRSADLERSQGFYEAVGLSFKRHAHGRGPEHLSCEQEGVVFEIYPAAGARESSASARIGFEVEDVDATVALLNAMGAEVLAPPADSPWGRRAVVRDFDGHGVELVVAKSRDSGE